MALTFSFFLPLFLSFSKYNILFYLTNVRHSSSGIRYSLHGIELHRGGSRRWFGTYLSVSQTCF